MARYEIRTAGWEFMPWTSDGYVARLEIHRDGSRWDAVPARVPGVSVLGAAHSDARPHEADESWSQLLQVAAAEVRARIHRGGKPSENAEGAAVYPCALGMRDVARDDATRQADMRVFTFDVEH